jgi:3'-phosphoadenosine 5'-phosphosulfate sulfotransferase (PAPS reductase)/FAD synthetase
MKRWCCSELKEKGGEGRVCVTGVRWAESTKRKKRKPFEIVTEKIEDKKLFNDNDEDRRLFETCMQKGKRVINPIIDWTDDDVWGYLSSRGIKHCCLYDQGEKRIGCIGCPLATNKSMINAFKKYPKYMNKAEKVLKKKFVNFKWCGNEKWIKLMEDYYNVDKLGLGDALNILSEVGMPGEILKDSKELTKLYKYIFTPQAVT